MSEYDNELIHIFKQDYLRMTGGMQTEIDALREQLKTAKEALELYKVPIAEYYETINPKLGAKCIEAINRALKSNP